MYKKNSFLKNIENLKKYRKKKLKIHENVDKDNVIGKILKIYQKIQE